MHVGSCLQYSVFSDYSAAKKVGHYFDSFCSVVEKFLVHSLASLVHTKKSVEMQPR